MKQTVCVDFDGVIHQYYGYTGGSLSGKPVDGAFVFLDNLMDSGFSVTILSARANDQSQKELMHKWFIDNGYARLNKLDITSSKPPALIYIDDKGYYFNGSNFPSMEFLKNFKPWWQKDDKAMNDSVEIGEIIARTASMASKSRSILMSFADVDSNIDSAIAEINAAISSTTGITSEESLKNNKQIADKLRDSADVASALLNKNPSPQKANAAQIALKQAREEMARLQALQGMTERTKVDSQITAMVQGLNSIANEPGQDKEKIQKTVAELNGLASSLNKQGANTGEIQSKVFGIGRLEDFGKWKEAIAAKARTATAKASADVAAEAGKAKNKAQRDYDFGVQMTKAESAIKMLENPIVKGKISPETIADLSRQMEEINTTEAANPGDMVHRDTMGKADAVERAASLIFNKALSGLPESEIREAFDKGDTQTKISMLYGSNPAIDKALAGKNIADALSGATDIDPEIKGKIQDTLRNQTDISGNKPDYREVSFIIDGAKRASSDENFQGLDDAGKKAVISAYLSNAETGADQAKKLSSLKGLSPEYYKNAVDGYSKVNESQAKIRELQEKGKRSSDPRLNDALIKREEDKMNQALEQANPYYLINSKSPDSLQKEADKAQEAYNAAPHTDTKKRAELRIAWQTALQKARDAKENTENYDYEKKELADAGFINPTTKPSSISVGSIQPSNTASSVSELNTAEENIRNAMPNAVGQISPEGSRAGHGTNTLGGNGLSTGSSKLGMGTSGATKPVKEVPVMWTDPNTGKTVSKHDYLKTVSENQLAKAESDKAAIKNDSRLNEVSEYTVKFIKNKYGNIPEEKIRAILRGDKDAIAEFQIYKRPDPNNATSISPWEKLDEAWSKTRASRPEPASGEDKLLGERQGISDENKAIESTEETVGVKGIGITNHAPLYPAEHLNYNIASTPTSNQPQKDRDTRDAKVIEANKARESQAKYITPDIFSGRLNDPKSSITLPSGASYIGGGVSLGETQASAISKRESDMLARQKELEPLVREIPSQDQVGKYGYSKQQQNRLDELKAINDALLGIHKSKTTMTQQANATARTPVQPAANTQANIQPAPQNQAAQQQKAALMTQLESAKQALTANSSDPALQRNVEDLQKQIEGLQFNDSNPMDILLKVFGDGDIEGLVAVDTGALISVDPAVIKTEKAGKIEIAKPLESFKCYSDAITDTNKRRMESVIPELKEEGFYCRYMGLSDEKKNKCPANGCVQKVNGKWRVYSGRTGKLWPQTYDSEESAKGAISAYYIGK